MCIGLVFFTALALLVQLSQAQFPYVVLVSSVNGSVRDALMSATGESASSVGGTPLFVALSNAEQLLRAFPLVRVTGASAALQGAIPRHARRQQAGPPTDALGLALLFITMSPEDAARLRGHPSVAALERDGTIRALGTEQTFSAALDRIDQRKLPLDGAFRFSQRGAGVVVFVMDSGLRGSHAEFAGRALPGANFAPDAADDDTEDLNGHGTHVSSLAVGASLGVAQGARVVPVRIYDASNEGPMSQALRGVDWILGAIRSEAMRGLRFVVNM